MKNISRILFEKEKLACITLDFELDYGDRTEEFNIIERLKRNIPSKHNLTCMPDHSLLDILENSPEAVEKIILSKIKFAF